MGKLIAQLNTTPDGFCSHTNVIADDELHDFSSALLSNASAALFGRVTYQLMERYWPMAAKDPSLPASIYQFARLIDDIDKFVITTTLKSTEWKKTTLLGAISPEEMLALKQAQRGNILTASPSIISQLTQLGLMDEYYFVVQPMIAGNGKRLFETSQLRKTEQLVLADTRQFRSGAILLHYVHTSR